MAELPIKITADLSQFQKDLAEAQSQGAKLAAQNAKKAESAWKSAGKAILGGVGTVSALGAAWTKLNSQVADYVDQLADASTRTGIAVETLNGLKLAAEASGGSFEKLESGLNQFPKRLADAAKGTGDTAAAFAQLGVSVTDTDGSLRDADAVFKETIAKINAIEDPTDRAATALQVFGKSGGAMLEALSGQELEDFVAMANKFGTDVGPAAQEAAAAWQREMANLQNVLRGTVQDLSGFGTDSAEALQVAGIAVVTLGTTAKGVFEALSNYASNVGDFWKKIFAGDIVGAFKVTSHTVSDFVFDIDDAIKAGQEAGQEYANYAVKLGDVAAATTGATAVTRDFTASVKGAKEEHTELSVRFTAETLEMMTALQEYDAMVQESAAVEAETNEAKLEHIRELRKTLEDNAEAQEYLAQRENELTNAIAEEKLAADEATKKSAQEATQAQISTAVDAAQTLSNLIGSVFADNKGAQLAAATVNTASAVVAALAYPPGPPATIPTATTTALAGAAQIAKIASTDYAHSGLGFNPAAVAQTKSPDEYPYMLKEREGVLNERGVRNAGGYSAIRKLNSGRGGSAQSFVGITKMGHKTLDYAVGKNIARPAAVRTEVKAIAQTQGRVGHRLRSST